MAEKIITKRKSIVCFNSKPVPDDILYSLFNAAQWAPSSYNKQPWRFIVGQNGDSTYNLIYQSLVSGNKEWAGKAPVLIVSVAEVFDKVRNTTNKYAWHDTAMAYSNMVYQATANNLFFHPMGGFSADIICENFNIPDEFEPVVVSALGYRGDCSGVSIELKQRENKERTRNPIDEFVFHKAWGIAFTAE